MPRLDNLPANNFTPRTYQVELLEKALEQDTIVFLSMGTGKTFIATMLIKELSSSVRGELEDGAKRTIFLVSTVPLVKQQAQFIKNHTELEVGEYCGALGVDTWERQRWLEEFRTHNVLVMTAQLFLNILLHGIVKLADINLLIFDECHHAVKHHPYREVMKLHDTCPRDQFPRILGLTASIVNNNIKPYKLEERIRALEDTLRSTVETSRDLVATEMYGAKPEEIVVLCKSYEDPLGLAEWLMDLLLSAQNFVKDIDYEEGTDVEDFYQRDPRTAAKKAIRDCVNIIPVVGLWGLQANTALLMKELEKCLKHESQEKARNYLLWAHTQLKVIGHICQEEIKTRNDMEGWIAPKVRKLVDILKQYSPTLNHRAPPPSTEQQTNNNKVNRGPDKLCALLFVEERSTAIVLDRLIKEMRKQDPDLKFIQCSYITGQGSGAMYSLDKIAEMQYRRQEEVLRLFRQHALNLLITTSVLEEGVDIPKCNLVIRFDMPKDYRSYVQSKGRARAARSKFMVLVDDSESEKFRDDLRKFKLIEEILRMKCHDRKAPTDRDFEEAARADEILPAYMPRKIDGSARVTMTSAISLVNRYCAKLPSDMFTHLTPRCKTVEIVDADPALFVSTLKLPINSPLKDPIEGQPMPRRKLAEMAVALQTCIKLHEIGELDDNLLPVGKEVIQYEEEDEWDTEEIPLGRGQPGTTKRRQYYDKQIAKCLTESLPQASVNCYLYIILLKLNVPLPPEHNSRGRPHYHPEESTRTFAFLTTKYIPKIPGFPIHTRSGEVTARIIENPKKLRLSPQTIQLVKHFHEYVYDEILRLNKPPLEYSTEKATVQFYVVVVDIAEGEGGTSRYVIDTTYMNDVVVVGKKVPMNPKPFSFHPELYNDCVVTPEYRNQDQPQRFYVARIAEELTPNSAFPSGDFPTFVSYYQEKYNISITNPNQPLLDVDHTTSRLNLLIPRHMNRKGRPLQESKRNKESPQNKQLLIPELCRRYPIQASLWRKAVCLPSVIYRMSHLLLAEELRVIVAQEAGVGMVELSPNFHYNDLNFGWDVDYKKQLTPVGEEEESVGEEGRVGEGERVGEEGKVGEEGRVGEGERVGEEGRVGEGVSMGEEGTVGEGGEPMDTCDSDCPLTRIDDHFSEYLQSGTQPLLTMADFSRKFVSENVLKEGDRFLMRIPGPSPATILQAMTMSNASDGYNLERLEMIGDSFLKHCITAYLYCTYPDIHEGKLSYLRSKQVSNLNLYRLAKKKGFPNRMVATIFEPTSNWLPPCFTVEEQEPIGTWCTQEPKPSATTYDPENEGTVNVISFGFSDKKLAEQSGWKFGTWAGNIDINTAGWGEAPPPVPQDTAENIGGWQETPCSGWKDDDTTAKWNKSAAARNRERAEGARGENDQDGAMDTGTDSTEMWGGLDENARGEATSEETGSYDSGKLQLQMQELLRELNADINENAFEGEMADKANMAPDLRLQHVLSDKSAADCVEALIGAYLTSCGERAALLFMSWLGLKVLPILQKPAETREGGVPYSLGYLSPPEVKRYTTTQNTESRINIFLLGFDKFEEKLGYRFSDRAYLLQAFTHPSYHFNNITDCYQRLEFLGDAVLDYLITRHLYDDTRQHSPGALTDLRSALVNNTIFASLAVQHDYHKYLKSLSPELLKVVDAFVKFQENNGEAQGMDSHVCLLPEFTMLCRCGTVN